MELTSDLAPFVANDPVPAVECINLVHRFGRRVVVDGLDFRIEQGEVFGLLGPNGAGKTTTIRAITALLKPESGHVRVFGYDVNRSPMRVRRLLGYVPQQISANPALTGRENMLLYSRLLDVPRNRRKPITNELLEGMGLTDAADRLVATYSRGMMRRLELAQALVHQPRLLVLDEPTIGLDPIAQSWVRERLHQLKRDAHMSVLLTTHYMDEADELCDRVALMRGGRIQALGSPANVKAAVGPGASLEDAFRSFTSAATGRE